jgi:shikimate kinase
MRERHVVLVGLMGSGKSTVGRKVADLCGVDPVDTDREIERRAGCSIRALFSGVGAAAFRELERAVVADVLSGAEPAVVACGGGAVLHPATRARLVEEDVRVVWLRASPDVLAGRVGVDAERPLLGADPVAAMRRLAQDRAPLYAEVADVVVDVADEPPDAVAALIMGLHAATAAATAP